MVSIQEMSRQVDGHWKDDGGVVLGRNAVQRLKVAQLQGDRAEISRGYFLFLATSGIVLPALCVTSPSKVCSEVESTGQRDFFRVRRAYFVRKELETTTSRCAVQSV